MRTLVISLVLLGVLYASTSSATHHSIVLKKHYSDKPFFYKSHSHSHLHSHSGRHTDLIDTHGRRHHGRYNAFLRSHHERARIFGSLFSTYLATVEIKGQKYDCIMDTGSSDFAVAASPECGCSTYYHGDCNGVNLFVAYGDGNWTGRACQDHVSMGGLSAGEVVFAGVKQADGMFECTEKKNQNGIIGLAFPPLLGPPANYTRPLFDLIAAHNKLDEVYGMQCCGWNHEKDEMAYGALDLGGVVKSHYRGEIFWTPITERVFYAVNMLDVRVDGSSVMPKYKKKVTTVPATGSATQGEPSTLTAEDEATKNLPTEAQTIVDSGTSNIVFEPVLYKALIAELKKHVSEQPAGVWTGDACISVDDFKNQKWPDITITFADENPKKAFEVVIPACRYLTRAPASECENLNGAPGHAFSIDGMDDEGNILGQVLYEGYYIVHDNARNRVGFAAIDGCNRDAKGCVERSSIRVVNLPESPVVAVQIDSLDLPTGRSTFVLFAALIALSAIVGLYVVKRARKRNEYVPIGEVEIEDGIAY